MAGAEKIIGKILEDARLKASANIRQAEDEAGGILKSAREEAEKKRKDILDIASKTAEDTRKRIISLAELEGRKKRLQARQEVLEEVFQDAMKALENLPAEQYEKIMAELVMQSVKTGAEEIVLSERDKARLGGKFIMSINSRLTAEGRTGSLMLSEEAAQFNGGFILKSGNMEVNQTFDTILKVKRDELEALVTKVLFG